MRNFHDTFKASNRSFVSAFSICMAVRLMNHDDYINSLRKIFDDSRKFKKLTKDLQLQD